MLIINDFFKRNTEAVSNQMEYCLDALGGKIVTATRFLGQKAFQKSDRQDGIFVYPPFFYNFKMVFEVLKNNKEDILVFEEESSKLKEKVFNLSKKDIYVAMYRKPNKEYIDHLKKYKKLKKVFVEMDAHKQLLIDGGIDESKIQVTYTPSKLIRQPNQKNYDPKNVNLIFASWNNTDKIDTSKTRGLFYIVDCLKKYSHLSLTIVLRDTNTSKFCEYVNKNNVADRVKFVEVSNTQELTKVFDEADFVVYMLEKQIVKDVPNSLIDGLSRGKPIIMTDVLSFAKVVERNQSGMVFSLPVKEIDFSIPSPKYKMLSENAFRQSLKHTIENYKNAIKKGCGREL